MSVNNIVLMDVVRGESHQVSLRASLLAWWSWETQSWDEFQTLLCPIIVQALPLPTAFSSDWKRTLATGDEQVKTPKKLGSMA